MFVSFRVCDCAKCSDSCLEKFKEKNCCVGKDCYCITNRKCEVCDKKLCRECRLDCDRCYVCYVCSEECIELHRYTTFCSECKEFGIERKDCNCSLHPSNICDICYKLDSTMRLDLVCSVCYDHKVCINVCKDHSDRNNLINKEDWGNYGIFFKNFCSFCKEYSCCSDFNNVNKLKLCSGCVNVNDVLNEKFSELENKVLLEYLYNIC